jgi:hypothetical protein
MHVSFSMGNDLSWYKQNRAEQSSKNTAYSIPPHQRLLYGVESRE